MKSIQVFKGSKFMLDLGTKYEETISAVLKFEII